MGSNLPDERSLLRAAASAVSATPGAVQLDAERPVIDVGVDMMGVPPQQAAVDQLPGTEAAAPTSWQSFAGVDVQFNASMLVVARDADAARALATYFADPANGTSLSCTPDSLVQVSNMNLSMSEMDDDGELDSGFYERE
jgi:hypothetical protein